MTSRPLVPHARLRRYGEDGFSVAPAVFFTPKRRAEFRKAAAGGRFDWSTKKWILTPDKVHAVVRNLRQSGFNVVVDDDALERYQTKELELAHEFAVLKDRIRRVNDALHVIGQSLYPFQVTGAEWLAQRDRAHLGDEMGAGKTRQILSALPFDAPVVVVCPVAIKGVWPAEAVIIRPGFNVHVLTGRESFRWPKPGQMVVLNYEILPDAHGPDCPDRKVAEDVDPFEIEARPSPPCAGCNPLLEECPDRCVVVSDEAHKLRGAKTQRTERFRAIARAARAKNGRTWLATGTPLVNRPQELWNLYEAADLAREAFGSYSEFVRLFGGTRKMLGNGKFAGIVWGRPTPEAAERIAKVSLRRLKQDVLGELPPRTWKSVRVELSREDLEFVDVELKGSGLTIESVVQAIEDGRSLGFQKLAAARAALAAAKTRVLVDYVRDEFEEQGEPVVVFSAHRAPIDHLGDRAGWAAISGDVSGKKRTRIVEDFQAGKLKGVALTIGAGSEGITLTRASNIVFVDRAWTPAENKQAEDRIHRIGQRFPCFYTDLVSAHPLDVRVTEILQQKARLIAETVDAAAALGGG